MVRGKKKFLVAKWIRNATICLLTTSGKVSEGVLKSSGFGGEKGFEISPWCSVRELMPQMCEGHHIFVMYVCVWRWSMSVHTHTHTHAYTDKSVQTITKTQQPVVSTVHFGAYCPYCDDTSGLTLDSCTLLTVPLYRKVRCGVFVYGWVFIRVYVYCV